MPRAPPSPAAAHVCAVGAVVSMIPCLHSKRDGVIDRVSVLEWFLELMMMMPY